MASGLLIDYLGHGNIASRPVTPTLFTGAVGLWWSDDTNELSLWDGSAWIEAVAGTITADDVTYDNATSGLTATDVQAAIDELAASISDGVSVVTESLAFTIDPTTHAGLRKYIRASGDVTFDVAEGYSIGEVYNIRATAALTLIGTGVTLTPPAGGTLDLDAAMSVTVIMTSSSAGDVIGQTVAA